MTLGYDLVPRDSESAIPGTRPRILIADDHALVLERVAAILTPVFDVVANANNGQELIVEVHRLQPDVVVLDVTMPILTGIEAARELRQAGSSSRFVFLTVHDEPAFLHACFAEGAFGYVIKTRLATDLLPAINDALCGHRFISPCLSR